MRWLVGRRSPRTGSSRPRRSGARPPTLRSRCTAGTRSCMRARPDGTSGAASLAEPRPSACRQPRRAVGSSTPKPNDAAPTKHPRQLSAASAHGHRRSHGHCDPTQQAAAPVAPLGITNEALPFALRSTRNMSEDSTAPEVPVAPRRGRVGTMPPRCRGMPPTQGRARNLPETTPHATSPRPSTQPSTAPSTRADVWGRQVVHGCVSSRRIDGKDGVAGSIPAGGSTPRLTSRNAGKSPSGAVVAKHIRSGMGMRRVSAPSEC
jgi:hypothetical protein